MFTIVSTPVALLAVAAFVFAILAAFWAITVVSLRLIRIAVAITQAIYNGVTGTITTAAYYAATTIFSAARAVKDVLVAFMDFLLSKKVTIATFLVFAALSAVFFTVCGVQDDTKAIVVTAAAAVLTYAEDRYEKNGKWSFLDHEKMSKQLPQQQPTTPFFPFLQTAAFLNDFFTKRQQKGTALVVYKPKGPAWKPIAKSVREFLQTCVGSSSYKQVSTMLPFTTSANITCTALVVYQPTTKSIDEFIVKFIGPLLYKQFATLVQQPQAPREQEATTNNSSVVAKQRCRPREHEATINKKKNGSIGLAERGHPDRALSAKAAFQLFAENYSGPTNRRQRLTFADEHGQQLVTDVTLVPYYQSGEAQEKSACAGCIYARRGYHQQRVFAGVALMENACLSPAEWEELRRDVDAFESSFKPVPALQRATTCTMFSCWKECEEDHERIEVLQRQLAELQAEDKARMDRIWVDVGAHIQANLHRKVPTTSNKPKVNCLGVRQLEPGRHQFTVDKFPTSNPNSKRSLDDGEDERPSKRMRITKEEVVVEEAVVIEVEDVDMMDVVENIMVEPEQAVVHEAEETIITPEITNGAGNKENEQAETLEPEQAIVHEPEETIISQEITNGAGNKEKEQAETLEPEQAVVHEPEETIITQEITTDGAGNKENEQAEKPKRTGTAPSAQQPLRRSPRLAAIAEAAASIIVGVATPPTTTTARREPLRRSTRLMGIARKSYKV